MPEPHAQTPPQTSPAGRRPAWAIWAARLRVPLTVAGTAGLIATVLLDVARPWSTIACLLLLVLGFGLYMRIGTVHAAPAVLRSPVRGRWVAVNSPADRVPSHGLHAYGQTYAVDLVHLPSGTWALNFGWAGPHTRRPQEYPGFGLPIVAPADGVVVKVRGDRADHGARTSYLGLVLLLAEGAWLEITGRLLGNHVILQVADHTYVLVAHLRRGSPTVRAGDRVQAGQVLGECGNSGNSSEPHVHLQVMDHPRPVLAAGLPFVFSGLEDGSQPHVPRTGQPFEA